MQTTCCHRVSNAIDDPELSQTDYNIALEETDLPTTHPNDDEDRWRSQSKNWYFDSQVATRHPGDHTKWYIVVVSSNRPITNNDVGGFLFLRFSRVPPVRFVAKNLVSVVPSILVIKIAIHFFYWIVAFLISHRLITVSTGNYETMRETDSFY